MLYHHLALIALAGLGLAEPIDKRQESLASTALTIETISDTGIESLPYFTHTSDQTTVTSSVTSSVTVTVLSTTT